MSYPIEISSVISLEQNLQSFRQSTRIVEALEEILADLQFWEESGLMPDKALGLLQLPVAGLNGEVLKAELPLRNVPKEGLPALQTTIAMMIDYWRQRGDAAFETFGKTYDSLRQHRNHAPTENDPAAVLAAAGADEN